MITLGFSGLIVTSPEAVSSNFEMLSSGRAVLLRTFTFFAYSALVGLNEGDNMSNSSSLLDIMSLKTKINISKMTRVDYHILADQRSQCVRLNLPVER